MMPMIVSLTVRSDQSSHSLQRQTAADAYTQAVALVRTESACVCARYACTRRWE